MKAPFITYADTETLLEKIDICHCNPKKSSTTKRNKHTFFGYSLFTHCLFDTTKSKHDCYRSKDCIKHFSKDLRKHARKITNYENKEIIPLTKEENKSYLERKVCHIWKKEFSNNDDNGIVFDKKYRKVRDHCHYTGKYIGAAHNVCNLRYKTPK